MVNWDKYDDWKNKNKKKSTKSTDSVDWEKYDARSTIGFDTLNDDINNLNTYLKSMESGWQDSETMKKNKDQLSSIVNRLSTYKKYLTDYGNDNDETKKYSKQISDMYDSYNNILNVFDEYANEYGKFTTKDEYEKSVAFSKTGEEGIKARKEWYESSKEKLKELDDNVPWYEKIPVIGDLFDDYNTLNGNDRREELQAYINEYERGKKVTDDYYDITKQSNFSADSQVRDYDNPTREELRNYDSDARNANEILSNGGYFDEDGKIRNSSGEIVSPDELPIADKLGMFLSASPDEIAEAYSELSAGNGNYTNTWANLMQEGDTKRWKYLDPTDIGIYYTLLKNEGQESAYKFLDDMEVELGRREEEAIKKEIDGSSALEKIAYNVASVPANVFGGAAAFIGDVSNFIQGEEYNPYSAAHRMQSFGQAVRESTAEDINELTGNVALPYVGTTFGDVYQSLMSGADSVLGASLLGGGYTFLMGMGSASSEAKELYDQGATTGQIMAGGILAGTAEALFEKVSLDHFLKIKDTKTMGQLIKQVLLQGGVEASEEVATEIVNTLTNAIVMGSQSDWAKYRDKYLSEGYSDAQATVKALFNDVAPNVINAGIGGFISGGAMAGMGSGANLSRYNSNAKKVGKSIYNKGNAESLIESTKSLEDNKTNAKLKAIAEQLASTDTSNGKPSSKYYRSLGKLYDNTSTAQRVQLENSDKQAFAKSVRAELESRGIENVDEATSVLTKAMYGQLNSKEAKLYDSIGGNDILNKVLNSDRFTDDKAETFTTNLVNTVKTNAMPYVDNGDKTTTSESNDYTEFDYNTDGKTIINKADGTSEDVNIKKIATVENGKLMLELDNGDIVDAKNVSFASESDAIVYESILNMGASAESGNVIISVLKGSNISDQKSINNAMLAYSYGLTNQEDMMSSLSLPDNAKSILFKAGRKDATARAENMMKKAQSRTVSKKASNKVNYVNEIDHSRLNGKQKALIETADFLAESTPMDIYIFESYKRNGKNYVNINGVERETTANGWFVEGTNKIYIDINAGNDYSGLGLFTLAHELGHYIRDWNATKWLKMADLIVNEINNQAKNDSSKPTFKDLHDYKYSRYITNRAKEQALIDKGQLDPKKADYAGKSDQELRDMAYEDVICDSLASLMTDKETFVQFANKLEKADKTLWEKLKDFIKSFLDKLDKALKSYDGVQAENEAGKAIQNATKEIRDQIRELYLDAFMGANENYNNASNAFNAVGDIDTYGEGNFARLSERFIPKSKEDINKLVLQVSKGVGVTETEARRYVESELSLSSIILGNKYLDYTGDDRYDAIKKNSDYKQGTVDFSNICRKRRAYTAMLDRLQKQFPNRIFTAEDMAIIRQAMVDNNLEVACAVCYVEDRRQLLGEIAQEFIDNYKDAQKTGESLYKYNAAGEKKVLNASGKTFNAEEYVPTIYDLVTLDGMKKLQANHPNVADAFNTFNNSRGMQAGRLLEGEAEYKREILGYSKDWVNKINDLGGLRIYSFSDFEEFHLVDVVQVIMDCAAKGIKIQGYTKVPAFAKLLKDTNVKINRSLIPKGKHGYHYEYVNGKNVPVLDFDDVEGINTKDEDFFDSTDSKNIGNILIGINDKQIKLAMLDDMVDYIIPFHSGQKIDILKLKKIDEWFNYKNFQEDKDASKKKVSKDGKVTYGKSDNPVNIYTDVLQAAEKEGNPITNEKQFVEKFLEVCEQRNLIPRFYTLLDTDKNGKFVYTKGYYKLLLDFKLFDKNGNILPQENVVPKFDNDYMHSLLEKYSKQKAKEESIITDKLYDKILNSAIDGGLSIESPKAKDYIAKNSERDSKYLELAKNPEANEAELRKMVDEAAKAIGVALNEKGKPIDLYHGTNAFGFTVFDGTIFTTTSKSVSAGYGKTDYASERKISDRYVQDDGTDSTLIKNVKSILNYDARNISQKDINEAREHFVRVSKEISDKVDSVWQYGDDFPELPDDINNSISWVLSLPQSIDEYISDTFDGYMQPSEIESYIENFEKHHPIAREYVIEHRDEFMGETGKPIYDLIVGFDLSDYAIDLKYKLLPMFTPDEYLINERGSVYRKETLRSRIEDVKNIGSYHLYGSLGDNPLVIDAQEGGQRGFWANIKVDEFGGDVMTTDEIVRKAKESGYSSVVIKNVYDMAMNDYSANVASDVYVFFDENQVKSADAVTYDDNGEVIPLSERFNYNNNDIRYSERDSDGNELSEGQIEYFKDSKVRDENGNLLKVYHGSDEDFTTFDRTKSRANMDIQGNFFSPWELDAQGYGSNVRAFYLDIKNPASESVGYKALNKFKGQNNAGIKAREYLESLGYDGVNNGGEEYIAFYPEQIKSVDNLNPTSDPDIRYSERVTDKETLDFLNEQENNGDVSDRDIESYDRTAILKESTIDTYLKDYASKTTPKYAQAYIAYMSPNDFLKLTTKYDKNRIIEESRKLDKTKFEDATIYQPIQLNIDTETGVVEGHEGRHRMVALYNAGIESVPVLMFDSSNKYNKEHIDSKYLFGQFDIVKMAKINDLVPFNYANREEIVNKFGTQSAVQKMQEKYNGKETFRYDERDYDISNRTLLANALESATKNDIEKNKLKAYKEKIDLINAEEKKLSETRSKIKELSFAKGPKDAKQISKLQAEATKTANRINVYDKQLLSLEASTPLKNVLQREREMVKKREAKRYRESLNALREKEAETRREIVSRYQESRKKAVESRNKTVVRNKIKKVVSDLNQLLLHGTKDKHILEGMQRTVAEALDMLNMDTVGADERIAKYDALIAKATDPDVIASLQATRDRIALQGENMSEKINKLKLAYADIKNSSDSTIANAFDEVIVSKIESLSEKIGNTSLRDMSIEQLEDVYDTYKMILTSIRKANKAFKTSKNESIEQLGNAVQSEVYDAGGSHERQLALTKFIKKQGWNSLKPIYAMRMIGSDTLTGLFNNLLDGQGTWYTDMSDAKSFRDKNVKDYHFNDWDFKKQYTFKAKSGKQFSMNLNQIMSLYAYSKRNQAIDHLVKGGIVFDSNIEVIEKKKGIPLKYTVNTADAFNLSEVTIGEIISNLTDEQKAFVDSMQAYLSNTMGAKGNEVSLELYGVKLFKEKFYFPLKSAKQYMFEQNEVAGEVRVKNSGFSKETVAHANNPIIISNFMDVWASHVNDMSMYHAFVLPLEDFNRVFNYRTRTDENLETMSVKKTLQNAYGDGVNEYIRNLITDLNGGARSQAGSEVINKLMGKFKKGAVFASASVTIQQPSAIARAMAYINPKYFVTSIPKQMNFKKHNADWEECKKYAPVAGIKEMGYFDTGMGQSSIDWINSEIYEGFRNKLGAFFKDGNYRDSILSKAPALADEVTWCHIWNAVKKEVADTTDLTVGTDEFLKQCGKRFSEVIELTQVYDSVLTRSGLMRSKDTGMKMATAFMAEPTTTINMIADAFVQGKRLGKAKGAKFIASSVGAVVGSIVLNSLLKSIVMAWRDDDDDKSYGEKYADSLSSDLISNLNPLSMIPIVKDVLSVFQGYDVSRADMNLFNDLYKAFNIIDSENKSTYQKVTAIIGAVSAFFGVPFKNVERDLRPIIAKIFDIKKED